MELAENEKERERDKGGRRNAKNPEVDEKVLAKGVPPAWGGAVRMLRDSRVVYWAHSTEAL